MGDEGSRVVVGNKDEENRVGGGGGGMEGSVCNGKCVVY